MGFLTLAILGCSPWAAEGPASPVPIAEAATAADRMPLEWAREMAVKSSAQARRLEVIAVLGERGTVAEVPVLVQALRDADDVTRALAEKALWEVFLRSGDAEADRLTRAGIRRMEAGDLEGAHRNAEMLREHLQRRAL